MCALLQYMNPGTDALSSLELKHEPGFTLTNRQVTRSVITSNLVIPDQDFAVIAVSRICSYSCKQG